MSRYVFGAALGLAALAIGCQGQKHGVTETDKKGPFVAQGDGVAITAEEFKARLDEQSPFIRARYTTLDRKKEFLDNLVRFEVLAHEAELKGLDKDPEVLATMKKVMVQKLIRQIFDDQEGAKSIPDTDLKKYYDDHIDEFVKPERVRVSQIMLKAEKGSPDHARKLAEAKKLVERLKKDEQGGKNPIAFSNLAREVSEDAASKPVGGDLTYHTKDELTKEYGAAVAEAAFGLKEIGQETQVVEGDHGLHILKLTGRQEALNRPFDQVKVQIASKLFRERKTKEFDEYVKKKKEEAKVVVNDAELDKIAVAGAPLPMPPPAPSMGNPMTGGFQPAPGAGRPPVVVTPITQPHAAQPAPAATHP